MSGYFTGLGLASADQVQDLLADLIGVLTLLLLGHPRNSRPGCVAGCRALQMSTAVEAQLQLVEQEMAQLEALLQDDALYRPPVPLYMQPNDIEAVREQVARHETVMAPRLKAHLANARATAWRDELSLRSSYRRQYDFWHKQVDQLERANNERHLFEELPRHDHSSTLLRPTAAMAAVGGSRSRSRSVFGGSDVVRSEEELNQVLRSLMEAERENPATRWMATLASVPPMDRDSVEAFIDRNSLIHTQPQLTLPTTGFLTNDGRAWSAVWTRQEETIFVDKFVQYGKDFARIASFLGPDKGRGDCVQFYYRNKKRLRLKQRSQSQRRTNSAGSDQVKKRVGRPPSRSLSQIPALPIREETEEEEDPSVSMSEPGEQNEAEDDVDLLTE